MAQHSFVHGIGILVDKTWFQHNFVHRIGTFVDKQEFQQREANETIKSSKSAHDAPDVTTCGHFGYI